MPSGTSNWLRRKKLNWILGGESFPSYSQSDYTQILNYALISGTVNSSGTTPANFTQTGNNLIWGSWVYGSSLNDITFNNSSSILVSQASWNQITGILIRDHNGNGLYFIDVPTPFTPTTDDIIDIDSATLKIAEINNSSGANKSKYLGEKILKHIFLEETYTPPSTLYFGLHYHTDINQLDTALYGNQLTYEKSGNGYARVAVTNNFTNFPEITSGNSKSNANEILFPFATGAYTVNAVSVHDASTGGNILYYYIYVSTTKTVNSGKRFRIAPNDFTVTEL